MRPDPMDIDPAQTGFQVLENMATAYWTSQVLFTALELELFRHLDAGVDTCGRLAAAAGCEPAALARLLKSLKTLGLVDGTREFDQEGAGEKEPREKEPDQKEPDQKESGQTVQYWNSQVAALYLVPGKPQYMGEFFLYRLYMRPQWECLTDKVRARPSEPDGQPYQNQPDQELSYEERNFRYVRAMDTLVRQKAPEIAAQVKAEKIKGPILDVGGGAGSLVRTIKDACKVAEAQLFDIPEVIEAAERLYPDDKDWEGITRVGGDFRTHEFDSRFGLIVLSNFLHAYGRAEARELLAKAATLLAPDGLLLIHDYFPDQQGEVPHKGALYDLAMMLNTYNGACQEGRTLLGWCRETGLVFCAMGALSSDSAVILARQDRPLCEPQDPLEAFAADLDLGAFVPISPKDVVTVPWARQKCQTGCALYDKGLQCPPYGMDHHQTRELLDSYSRAYLIRSTPPGNSFHKTLLSLEKKAFLEGFHKAFVMGAGPCSVCADCPPDTGACRFPHLARPSMEGSGIDVYTTAAHAGIPLKPVQERGQYVTYIGLLLVE